MQPLITVGLVPDYKNRPTPCWSTIVWLWFRFRTQTGSSITYRLLMFSGFVKLLSWSTHCKQVAQWDIESSHSLASSFHDPPMDSWDKEVALLWLVSQGTAGHRILHCHPQNLMLQWANRGLHLGNGHQSINESKHHWKSQANHSASVINEYVHSPYDNYVIGWRNVNSSALFSQRNVQPSVLWCCWLGGRKGIRPVKNWVVGCWRGCLHGVQTCI